MEFLNQFSAPVVTGICLCIGYIIKNLIPSERVNKFIPLISGLIGVGLNAWLEMGMSPQIILTGLLSGLASTGLYEAFHQFLKK